MKIFLISLSFTCFCIFSKAQATSTSLLNGTSVYIDTSVTGLKPLILNTELKQGVFHLFAHGRPGELYINNKWLPINEIELFLKQFIIGETGILPHTHLNIYACDFAKGEKGKEAMKILHTYFNGGVAASDNKVGSISLDGDWEMETVLGSSKNILKLQYTSILNIPNTFTPNGDGENDVFMAYGEDISLFEMLVFDRWGGQIFKTEDINIGWEGFFNGKDVESGSFIVMITATGADGQQYNITKNINLVR